MIRDVVGSIAGYPGLFVLCATSGILVPLPEDFALLYAGVRLASGDWAWAPVIAVAIAGVLARDVLAWSIGRGLGVWLLESYRARRFLGGARLERARAMVSERGAVAVLFGRFLVGFRSPVFVMSGAMGVSLRAFVLWDLIGLVVAVPVTVSLGYAFGEPMAELAFWLLQRFRLVVLATSLLGLAWAAWRWRARAPDEVDSSVP